MKIVVSAFVLVLTCTRWDSASHQLQTPQALVASVQFTESNFNFYVYAEHTHISYVLMSSLLMGSCFVAT